MLSLVLILWGIGLVFAIRSWQKNKYWCCKVFINASMIVVPVLFVTWFAMFTVVKQNDTGYLQQQVDTLTEVNKQMENWIEIIEYELSDNPELLNHVEEYLNEEITSNNEEISRCIGLQENRVTQYRWLIYFR